MFRVNIHKPFFSSQLMNEPIKREYYITIGWKDFLGKNTLAYQTHL
jgi:hypothetical protein